MTKLFCLLLALMMGLPAAMAADQNDDDREKWDKEYETVDYALVMASPEKYKNKKIAYEGVYLGYTTTFPRYMEDSGIKSTDYIGIGLTNLKVPAIAKKSRYKDLDVLIAPLPRQSKLKFYGKIKKFRHEPDATVMPRYYLELVHAEVIEKSNQGGPAGTIWWGGMERRDRRR